MTKQVKARSFHVWRIFLYVLIIVGAALQWIEQPGPSTYMQLAGLLCIGWVHFFVQRPAGINTLGDVYKAARQGWKTPPSAKAMMVLGLIMMSLGFYLEWR